MSFKVPEKEIITLLTSSTLVATPVEKDAAAELAIELELSRKVLRGA
jgi:hypothetical protein